MTSSGNTDNTSPLPTGKTFRDKWLSFRRKRFWILLAILLYAVLGFLVAPRIIHNNIVGLFQEEMGRETHIENIDVNPFALSLRIEGFELDDKDGVRLASFEDFVVNFQLSSIFNRAWTFRELRLANPYFLMERYDQADSRLKRLISDFSLARPAELEDTPDADMDQEMPRLLIHDLTLAEGQVDLKDHLPETLVQTHLSPIKISIQGLNTLPDRNGEQLVTIQLADGASLKWSGSLTLGPLDSEGELVLEGLRLDPLIAYLPASIPIESLTSTISASLDYHVRMDPGGQPEVDVTDLQVTVKDTLLNGMDPLTKFVDIPDLSLSDGVLRYPQQTVQFSSLVVGQPRVVAWLKEDGSLSLQDLVPANDAAASDDATTPPPGEWQIGIDEFELRGGAVEFSDTGIEPVARLDVLDLDVSLTGISNAENVVIPLTVKGTLGQGGSFGVEGTLALLPDFLVNTRINTQDLPLSIGQPYAQQFAHVRINGGNLNSDIELNLSADGNLTSTGSAQIPSLDVINTFDDEKLLNWGLLDIDQFDFNLNSRKLHLSQLNFGQLYGKFVLDENKETNLAALMIEREVETPESPGDPLDFIIGGILINDSSMDFSDLSLPLPFATYIVDLNGRVSTIDTGSDAPANVTLEGQVDEFGLARINGSINVLDPVMHTDMTLEFRNLLMSNLSPYTVQFAGREIDQGKLDLDLGYVIENGLLDGSNNVVLSDLELGKEVDHPDAASLPLGLAVSLLKDSDGVIKVDLPVGGDINDPEFEIGGVIWQAFSGMITKLISAPFRLLGNLIGIESEDLGQFEFLAGRFDLTPPELEKVVQLEEALKQRPELVIEVGGAFDPGIDVPALKRSKLITVATERLGGELGAQDDRAMMLDDEIRALVEEMFGERFPQTDREGMKAGFTAPPPSEPEGAPVLDELAYATALWARMVDAETVSEQELQDLAEARAREIKDAFLAGGQFDESRLVITAPKQVESGDDEWVILELSVASK